MNSNINAEHLAPNRARGESRREVQKRSAATDSPPGDREELLRLLWAKARAGSVVAMTVLMRELKRDEPSVPSHDSFIDELTHRRRG